MSFFVCCPFIQLACEILKDNPDMFFVSVGLMLVHVVFTAIWLVFFSRVFLIGHIESTVGQGEAQAYIYCIPGCDMFFVFDKA